MTPDTRDSRQRGDAAYPMLTDEQFRRLADSGAAHDVREGDIIYRVGDQAIDLVVIETGAIALSREATIDSPEELVVTFHARDFIGELGLLTGEAFYLAARVVEPGRIHRVSPQQFRVLMETDAELSDILLTSFMARRELLRSSASKTMEIVGSALSAGSLALRTYASRIGLPHLWFEAESIAGTTLMREASLQFGDLPAVLLPGDTIRHATPELLADRVGLTYRKRDGEDVDLVAIGGGPAGLAAAVYGASEGLETIMP